MIDVAQEAQATEPDDQPAPEAIDLILTIAEQYGINKTTARDWLVKSASEIEATEF